MAKLDSDLSSVSCLLCGNFSLNLAVKFPSTPLANALPKQTFFIESVEDFYPLELGLCNICGHLQLTTIVDPKILFKDYPYLSNSNEETSKRFQDLASEFDGISSGDQGRFVLEIGSNDGFLLKLLQAKGWVALGVDPAEKASKIAKESGVNNICDFFSEALSESILRQHGKPDLIVANNVLAHTDQMESIFSGITNLMKNDSLFVMEFSYAVSIFKKLLFDTIYHEHMSYHQIRPLQLFLKRFDLQIVDAVEFGAHGGSLRIYIRKIGFENQSKRLLQLIESETSLGLNDPVNWNFFEKRVENRGEEVNELLENLKMNGATVAGYGIPAKFSTLFHVLKLKPTNFEYFVDDNPLKIGRFAPGTKMEIFPQDKLFEIPVDYIFIFSWNYADTLIQRIKELSLAKKAIIIPLPELRIVLINETH